MASFQFVNILSLTKIAQLNEMLCFTFIISFWWCKAQLLKEAPAWFFVLFSDLFIYLIHVYRHPTWSTQVCKSHDLHYSQRSQATILVDNFVFATFCCWTRACLHSILSWENNSTLRENNKTFEDALPSSFSTLKPMKMFTKVSRGIVWSRSIVQVKFIVRKIESFFHSMSTHFNKAVAEVCSARLFAVWMQRYLLYLILNC